MAGDWIKMRADLFTHPKVVRIASALKADRLRAVGGLMAVWCLFDAHSDDGKLDGYTLAALDDLVGWPGFSGAMVDVGWLEDHGDSLATPRFDEHNGQSAKRRATETQRKRMARAEPEMSAPDADKLRSREEKRREELKKEKRAPSAPRARRCPVDWSPTQDACEEIARDCPGVDLDRETKNFRDWEFKDPKTDWSAAWRRWMRKAHADLKPTGETAYQRSMRERVAEIHPALARRAPSQPNPMEVLDGLVTVARITR